MLLHPLNPLAGRIQEDPEWVKVYASPIAFIFLKDNDKNREKIKLFKEGGQN
jgi:hypothetical protein